MRLRTALMSMALGLTVVGLVYGEDESTGNWFTRAFTPAAKPAPETPKIDPAKKVDAPPVPSSRERRRDAEKAFNRRLEVILKLYELADQLNDAELQKSAEILDQRNSDAYKAACVPDREALSAQAKSTKEPR